MPERLSPYYKRSQWRDEKSWELQWRGQGADVPQRRVWVWVRV